MTLQSPPSGSICHGHLRLRLETASLRSVGTEANRMVCVGSMLRGKSNVDKLGTLLLSSAPPWRKREIRRERERERERERDSKSEIESERVRERGGKCVYVIHT